MRQRTLAAAVVLLLALPGCRSTAPAGAAFQPLTATTAEAARAELQQRRAAFEGARALVRIRATTAEGTRSFRAQMLVRGEHVELTAYTPVGTVAATLAADGDRVTLSETGREPWTGSARTLGGPFSIFNGALTPAEVGTLITGLPATSNVVTYEMTQMGMALAVAGELSVRFEPPVYPPQHVVVERGADRLEIDFLELEAAE